MITTATAILLPCLPLGIAAGVGWIRENRLLRIARDRAAYLDRALMHRTKERDQAKLAVAAAQDAANYYQRCWRDEEAAHNLTHDRMVDTEDRLRRIERQRSETTRKGNLTKAARAKTLRDATTAEVVRTTKRVDAAADLQEAA